MKNVTVPIGTAANAIGISPKVIRRWLDHGVIELRRNDVRSRGTGSYCGLSRNRVMQIAITHRLAEIGLSPKRAAKAAFQFTDIADLDREPCALHHFGQTVLVIGADRCRIANTGFDAGIADFVPAAAILDLNTICASVDAALKENACL